MKRLKMLALVLPLAFVGCILTTGQITIDFDIGTVTITSPDNMEAEQVDLNTIQDYVDHKEDLEGVADMALLGEVENTGPALGVEAWLTKDVTNYTTDTQVRANGILVWGPFDLAAGETKRVQWDDSAKLFSPAGKQAVIDEVQGDGIFTVYILGAAGSYSFNVTECTLVLVLDAKP